MCRGGCKVTTEPTYCNIIVKDANETTLSSKSYEQGTTITSEEVISWLTKKDGYEITIQNSDGSTFTSTTLTSDLTLTAVYTAYYTVTIKDSNGNTLSSNSYKEGTKITSDILTTLPEKTGYTLSIQYPNGSVFSSATLSNNLTLTEVYTPITYTVKFIAQGWLRINGEENEEPDDTIIDTKTYSYDQEFTLPSTKDYHTSLVENFIGWTYYPSATGKFYKSEETISNLTSNQDAVIEFYLTYGCNVTFSTEHGTAPLDISRTCYDDKEDSDLTSQIYVLSETGYTFGGWYSDESYTNKVSSITRGSTGNITLYAKWTPNEYLVYFYSNYGNSNTPTYSEIMILDSTINTNKYLFSQKFIYDTTTTLTPTNWYTDKWIFTGWNTKADGSGDSYADEAEINWTSTSNLSLYAQWESKTANIYTITVPTASTGDLILSSSGSTLKANKSGFIGTFYWYVDGSNIATYTDIVITSNEYSYFDCKKYLGTSSTSIGIHNVMVKIVDNGNIYTQTAVVALYPQNINEE